MPGQVSTSNTTAAGARGGDTKIVPQGQTSDDYSNDPFYTTRQGRTSDTQPLKP